MDVAIQARFDATQALKDSDALFNRLTQVQNVAANIHVNTALTGQITGIANATAILANAQMMLQSNITLTNNAATAAANALAKMAQAQQALLVTTTQNITVNNNQNSALGSLANRVLGMVSAYVSLRTIMNLVREAMGARIEMDRLEIGMKAITTNANEAALATQFLKDETNRLGLDMRATIPEFVKMMASLTSSGMSFKDSEAAFTNLSIATKAVGLSSASTARILYDMQEMAAMGSVQMRQLRMMLMQLPGALQAFSQAAGVTTAQFLEQVHKGLIDPSFIATKGLQALADKYAHEMPEALDTTESHVNRLKNAWMSLMAEFGKSAAIKESTDLLTKAVSFEAKVMEMRNAGIEPGRIFTGAGQTDGRVATMDKLFPHTKGMTFTDGGIGAGFNIGGSDANVGQGTADAYTTYIKRQQAEQAFQRQAQAKTAAAAPPPEVQLTEAQMDAFDKIEEIRKRTEIEALQGLQKEYAQIDLNTQRQMDAIDKEQTKIKNADGGQDAAARARLDIIIAGNKAKEQARQADDAKNVQTYLEQIKSDSTDVANIMRDLIPDEMQRKVAEVDERFEKMRDHLQEIQDRSPNLLPQGWEDALDTSRRKAIEDVKNPEGKSPVGFQGQEFGSLSSKRVQLQKSLLTETDVKKYQKITDEIQAISREMALQLHNDAAGIGKAFGEGVRQSIDSMGSLDERVAKVGASITTSISDGATNALTGLIMGTKSASQAFSEMSQSIVSSLVQMIIKELIVDEIMSALKTAFSLSHQGGVAGESMRSAGMFHDGGVTGESSRWSQAPRFHGGGTIGDEVPIVARKGEVIFTPEQMKVLTASRGTRGEQKVEIANYTDPRMIDAHIARNPHVIVNAIMSQKKKVQKILT